MEIKWHLYNTASQVLWKMHYSDVIMGAIASQITSLTIVYSTVYSSVDQTKHKSLRAGNSPVTDEFPAQMASNAENVSIWWRHHGIGYMIKTYRVTLMDHSETRYKIFQQLRRLTDRHILTSILTHLQYHWPEIVEMTIQIRANNWSFHLPQLTLVATFAMLSLIQMDWF